MAVPFPSYLDALIEGFPPALTASSVSQHKYTKDSQNVGEFIEKLFGRLSVLLFHIEKQINRVLIQGRLLPKKVNQWAMEARALKRQVGDLLQKQKSRKGDSLNCDELVELGIRMIHHLKKCPCKDEMMYDKAVPVIIQRRESGLDKPDKGVEEEYDTGKRSYSYLEGKKARKTERSLDPVEDSVLQNQDSGVMSSAGTILPTVKTLEKDVEESGSEQLAISESVRVSRSESALHTHSRAGIDFASISEEKRGKHSSSEITEEGISEEKSGKQSSTEITEEGISLDDSKRKMSYGENQVVHRNESSHITNEFFLEEKHYSVSVNDDNIKLELDHQTIMIEICQLSTHSDSSSVNPVLNLAEQDLHELLEKPDYRNTLVLLLQRNHRLKLIHSSFFYCLPHLHFVDLSDTRIKVLTSSLFSLPKLKVLMLRNCVCLEKLPTEIEDLSQMEVLDLSGTELCNLPDEIGKLILLRHMKISFYGPDDESEYDHLPSQLVSPSFLSELKNLQALSVTVHPDDHRWTDIVASIAEDVSKLETLSYLQFYFPELETFEKFIQTSPSWNNNMLSKFGLIVGHNVKRIASRVPDEVESLFGQHDKCLRLVNGDKVTLSVITALTQVTAFYLDHHTEIQSLSEFDISSFRALKCCVVRECPKIQTILEGKTAEAAFPCLEHLGIYYLWELKHIWVPPAPPGRLKRMRKAPMASVNFKALKFLTVNTCPKLQFVLQDSMLHCLSNLEELVVEDCERVEKIIKEGKKKVKYDDGILPGLRKLVLRYLPELVSLGNGICLSQEKVSVHSCPKYRSSQLST